MEEVRELLQTVRDPEFTHLTLGELKVIGEHSISIRKIATCCLKPLTLIEVRMLPTTPHCHLVQQIGLSIHLRLVRELPNFREMKLRVTCEPGSHLKQK